MESLEKELAAIEEVAHYCQKKIAPQSAVASSSCSETHDNGGNTASLPHNNVKGSFNAKGGFSNFSEEEGDIQSMKDGSSVPTKAKQRNSISLNGSMMPNLADLRGLVDSDSDEEESSPIPAPHVPNLKASGGPQHRPLVGGFAAAAYEAARVDYYKKQGVSVRGHQSSRPPRSAPRYP